MWDSHRFDESGTSFGQQKPNAPIRFLTVCEVLGNVKRYADNDVAVVGRMERSVSSIDHYEFLAQDHCKHPLMTHGHVFRQRIQIETGWEEGMSKPPSDKRQLDERVVAAKLALVRKTTNLGTQEEPRFGLGGVSVPVPNEWVVVYGRILKTEDLEEDCGREGCGGDDVPLVIIAIPEEVHRLRGDGVPLPKHK